MISKSDIIFALVQYQHDIILTLLLLCSETSDKNNCLISIQVLMRKIRFSKFQNNEYDVMIECEVTRRQVKMTSSKLTSSNGYISRR